MISFDLKILYDKFLCKESIFETLTILLFKEYLAYRYRQLMVDIIITANPLWVKIKLTNNANIFRVNALTHYENECLDKLIKQHKDIPEIITADTDLLITKVKNSVGRVQDFYVEAITARVKNKVFRANGLNERDNFKQITKAVEYLKNLAIKS